MTKREGYEPGSTIHDRLDSIRMTQAGRQIAIGAMRDAFIIVDACMQMAQRIRQLGASLRHRSIVGH